MTALTIRTVAILGAGVMGAQIAAHFTNAGFVTRLFDLAGDKGDPNALTHQAIERLSVLKPAPLFTNELSAAIQACNYAYNLNQLSSCDLIIEAIAEREDLKIALYEKITPYLNENSIIASNTSGISLNKLVKHLPEKIRTRFMGIHFFNPPRYMRLVELIPTQRTDPKLLDQVEALLVTYLGKTVVRAKDTPNFIANRIGIFAMLATMIHAEHFNIGLEIVDALTGPLIGRAKSATFRTMDVVGLDTMQHVVQTMHDHLKSDPWASCYQLPQWLLQLIEQGALGQKTGKGIYQKINNEIYVFDLKTQEYRPATGQANPAVIAILQEKDPVKRFQLLQQSPELEAQFLWASFRDLWHYAAYHLAEVAHTVRDVDLVLRYGFGWKEGPFETWQRADFATIQKEISEGIQQHETLATAALPSWTQRNEVYSAEGAFAPASQELIKRSNLPVYQRQPFPDAVLAEVFDEGQTIFENEFLRFWHQDDDIGIISFKTKMNTISVGVLESIQEALKIAEKAGHPVVLWQRHGDHFSAGADLSTAVSAMQQGNENEVLRLIEAFQQTSMAIRYALIPVVAAVKGYVFGGGCELVLHCDRIVAAAETFIGLVEARVGLLPAGGGCKAFAERASMINPQDPFHEIYKCFRIMSNAQVSTCAQDAKKINFLKRADRVVMHPNEILFVAKAQARALADSGYRPPLRRLITTIGEVGLAKLEHELAIARDEQKISAHDYKVGLAIATVLCGGKIKAGLSMTAEHFLALEREYFMALARTPATQERIAYTLKTGKPLKN